MKRKVCITIIILAAITILLGIWGWYNYKTNPDFFFAPLSSIITILITIIIAVFVSYFLVSKDKNVRKQKDIIYDLIQDLDRLVNTESTYKLAGQNTQEINMRIRTFNNKIVILEDSNVNSFFKKDNIEQLRKHFDEYRTFIGNHIEDNQYLAKSELELRRPLELIDTCLVNMSLSLYQ